MVLVIIFVVADVPPVQEMCMFILGFLCHSDLCVLLS